MDKFRKNNLSDIPIEEAHGGSGSRQVLVKPEQVTSKYFEAMTKGFLKSGGVFDWHTHNDTDEVFIVLKGHGKFYCEEKITEYDEGDIVIIPANLKHKIEASGDITNEYYFVRVRAK
ncbi:cupin domain-containing protein [Patescibacteria group bacterium]|nr:cupin domain-containing protein [Patescibacteria group bacterium]